jgi:hypothetical protein
MIPGFRAKHWPQAAPKTWTAQFERCTIGEGIFGSRPNFLLIWYGKQTKYNSIDDIKQKNK